MAATKRSKEGKPVHARDKSIAPLDQEQETIVIAGDQAAQETPETPLLPGVDVDVPAAVQNDLIHLSFVDAQMGMYKDDRILTFHFSFFLVDGEHEQHIPPKVLKQWRNVKSGDVKRVDVKNVPEQTIELFQFPKDKKAMFKLSAATISAATIVVMEVKGDGKTKKERPRFSFRATVGQTKDRLQWAGDHHSLTFWASIVPTQGEIE